MYREAIEEYRKALELAGPHWERLAGLARVYGLLGNTKEARHFRASLEEAAQQGSVSVAEMATVDLALGEKDRALDRLREAARQGRVAPLTAGPEFDPLRSPPYAEFFRAAAASRAGTVR